MKGSLEWVFGFQAYTRLNYTHKKTSFQEDNNGGLVLLQMTSILFAFKSCYDFGRLSFKSFAAVKQNPPSKIQEISWLAKYFCSTSRFFCQHSSGCPDVSMGRATIKDCNCKTLVSPAEFRRRVSVCGLDSLVSSKLLAALWCAASYQPGQGFRFNFLLFIKNCFSEGDFCLRSAYSSIFRFIRLGDKYVFYATRKVTCLCLPGFEPNFREYISCLE